MEEGHYSSIFGGKRSATSGLRTMTLDGSFRRLAYFPLTRPPGKSARLYSARSSSSSISLSFFHNCSYYKFFHVLCDYVRIFLIIRRATKKSAIPFFPHLPNAGKEAVPHQGNITRPSGILREYPLFGTDAVEQGCPAHNHQQHCSEIIFIEAVTNVREHVGQIHRVAYEPVGASCCQAPEGRPDAEPSAQTEEAGEAQTPPEYNKHQSNPGPRRLPGTHRRYTTWA